MMTPGPTDGRPGDRDPERGSMSVELVLLTVPLVVILLFVVALGRDSTARNEVNEAARDAARQASLHPDSAATAREDADRVAAADLAGSSCRHRTIAVDTSAMRAGGTVAVTVRCEVPLGDLVLLRTPGTRTVTATSRSVIDTYSQP